MKKTQRLVLYIILLLIICFKIYGQETNSFYKHYSGNLDSNMFMSCDLISQNGTVSAWYYYYFENPGSADTYLYGKTLPLEGTISGNYITLWEKNNINSKFSGVIESDLSINGTWQKKETDKPIPFSLISDKRQESVSLNCYSLQDEHLLLNGEGAEKRSPRAKIDLFLVYPEYSDNRSLQPVMDTIITKFLLNKKQSITSPQSLLEDIRNSYFDSYIKSTEGIDAESIKAFNWEKNTSMDILYNENHILSFKFEKYINTGGEKGLMMNKYFVFNTENNTRITISDLFEEGALNFVDNLLNEKLRKMNGIMPAEKLSDAGFFADYIRHTENFYVNNDGIGFLYNVYEIAPYTSGTTELFLPFKEIKDSLKPGHQINWIQ